MFDLKAQLGDYLDHVVDRLDIEDIFEERVGTPPVWPVQPRVPRRGVPRWVFGITAAAAVLILIGGLGLLSGVNNDSPPATTPPPNSTTTLADTYPRGPTTEELGAVARYYDGRNDASHSPATLRQFWLETAHPALGCSAADFEEIHLPPAGDPTWSEPIIMVPDIDAVVMVTREGEFGPVAEVPMIVDEQSQEYGQTADQLFIVDGAAHGIFFECAPQSPETRQYQYVSLDAQVLLDRIHSPDFDAALAVTYSELVAVVPQDIATDEFLTVIRLARPDFSGSLSDAELIAQAESACAKLSEWGADGNYEASNAPGLSASPEALEQRLLEGPYLFYWGGRAMCRDPGSIDPWREWVRIDLDSGFSDEAVDSMLYGLVDFELGNRGPEYLGGVAVTYSVDEWEEFILRKIDDNLDRRFSTPSVYGQLHAYGKARVIAES